MDMRWMISLRDAAHRRLLSALHLLNNEAGQDVLTWLLIIFVLWLIIAGRRVIVQ
jgi:cytochrome b subunit of formate dehydrogenase